jgi:hypothetical protein
MAASTIKFSLKFMKEFLESLLVLLLSYGTFQEFFLEGAFDIS